MEKTLRNSVLVGLCILFFLAFTASTFAWECSTKIKICENNYGYNGDCCKSLDNPIYHHCLGNLSSCRARLKAEEYKDVDMDLYYSLTADSNDPSLWYALSPNEKEEFQSCVNNYVSTNREYWVCSQHYEVDGMTVHHLYADQNLISNYIKEPEPEINETNSTNIPEIVEEEKGWFQSFLDWLSSLF